MARRREPLPIVPIVIVCAVILIVVALIGVLGKDSGKEEVTAAGITYLQSLEDKKPALISQVRKNIHQAKLDAKRDELLGKLSSGELDPYSLFEDYVVLGDSRAVGFYYFGFLDKARVLAEGGNTIRNIEKNMDKIVALNPSTIFLCYGLNDRSIGFWNTAEEYAAEYMQIISDLQGRFPDATIVVSSTLPARDPAFDRSSKWRDIPQWNVVLQAACKEKGVLFVDNSQISEEHADLWEQDGIHVRKPFYPYWGANLITAVLMEDLENEDA